VTFRLKTGKPVPFFTVYNGEDSRSSLAGSILAEESNVSDGEKLVNCQNIPVMDNF
jgi:hypothetical protein